MYILHGFVDVHLQQFLIKQSNTFISFTDLRSTDMLFQSLGPTYATLFWNIKLFGLATLKTVAVCALVVKTLLSINWSFSFKENIIFMRAIFALSLMGKMWVSICISYTLDVFSFPRAVLNPLFCSLCSFVRSRSVHVLRNTFPSIDLSWFTNYNHLTFLKLMKHLIAVSIVRNTT